MRVPPLPKPSSSASDEVYTVAEGSVGFDISSMSNSGPFVCGYTSHGKTAKFRIELDPAKVSEKDPHISYGTGRLVSEPGSQPAPFLAELAKALEAKKIPKKNPRSASLAFEYIILAYNFSRSANGNFNDSPNGNWTLLKLFFADSQAELYLSIDVPLKKAEFSIKDPEYGDYLLAQFAKVL
jgi:hypothetical protein